MGIGKGKSILIIGTVALLLCEGLAVSAAWAASADATDYDVDLQAKVAREKLKQRRASSGDKAAKGASNSECGKVDIGNDDDSSRASRRVAPRDKTVIVTGPVINAAKCR